MRTNFALIKFHNFTLTELKSMYPWEREVYVHLVAQWIREQEEKEKQ